MDKLDGVKRARDEIKQARAELAALEEMLADSPHAAEVNSILEDALRRLAQELLEL